MCIRDREDIKRKASTYAFCSDLAEKHLNQYNEPEKLAVWNIVELLSFGNFMELYTVYYQTYKLSLIHISYNKASQANDDADFWR